MGMYTGLRVKAKIKEEFVKELRKVIVEGESDRFSEPWKNLDFAKFPFVKRFSEMGRSSMIPYGAICYMPDSWEYENNFENDVWTFCCSLKNYNSEIEVFLKEVLVNIAEYADAECLYEEELVSALFKVEDGTLIVVRESEWGLWE